ncbi:hypothetical protein RD792_012383 [Penstemon davidsonii]|uniref:Uncharacterized protein n=1 Tax=Penstemon davidsonii TaxID=160366 RepID=A0ABR0CY29_9LAMI|nr:hypothetical protein RD792_012383 [Penstemon davidsonii]
MRRVQPPIPLRLLFRLPNPAKLQLQRHNPSRRFSRPIRHRRHHVNQPSGDVRPSSGIAPPPLHLQLRAYLKQRNSVTKLHYIK